MDEDDICKEQIEEIVKTLKKKKATSTDKIPNEAMRAIFEIIGEEIAGSRPRAFECLQHCLETLHFEATEELRGWKEIGSNL